jgi:protein-disulfide isomerase
MFDYTCPHCRNTHHAISGAQKKYGNDLAIFALPVPLENACNPSAGGGHPGACEMAKIAVAVWRLDPSKFQTFHNWMFENQRTVSTARAFAETLIDKDRLKAELSSDVPGKYISRHVSLYQRIGSGQVPKLIFTKTMMQGEVNSTDTLCKTIQSELAVVQK